MKKNLYFIFIALFICACQQENVEPAGATGADLTESLKSSACPTYPFHGQPTNPSRRYLLVGFDPTLTATAKLAILNRFAVFDSIQPDFLLYTGPVTEVVLKPGITCTAVANMVKDLEHKKQVNWVYPVFDLVDPDGPVQSSFVELWEGFTDEITVTLATPNDYADLLKLTRTTINVPKETP
jgi:hypothetical protein